MVQYADLPKWLERYQPLPRPKPKSRSVRIASAVKANREQIVVATEAPALQIDDKLAKLQDQHPNDPDAIAALKLEISDYEALRAQVATLQHAVAKLTASAQSKEQAAKAAMFFGDGVTRLVEQTAREHSRQISRDGTRIIGRWSVLPAERSPIHGNGRRYRIGGWEICSERFERKLRSTSTDEGFDVQDFSLSVALMLIFLSPAQARETKTVILLESQGAAPFSCDPHGTLDAKRLKECEDASESGSKDPRGEVFVEMRLAPDCAGMRISAGRFEHRAPA